MVEPTTASRVHGCLLGGAVAEAAAQTADDGGCRFAAGTQLALYTVDGLVEALDWANQGVAADETACLWLAYLRWFTAQGHRAPSSAPVPPARWLDGQEAVRRPTAADPLCVSALATGEMGSTGRPLNAGARGSGAAVRSAPFGLVSRLDGAMVARLSSNGAALTHGDASDRESAAAFSLLIHAAVEGTGSLRACVAVVEEYLGGQAGADGVLGAVQGAVHAADRGTDADAPGAASFRAEPLAAAVHAVLSTAGAEPAQHFRDAVRLASQAGPADTAAAMMAGSLLGAFYGEGCLPADELAALEGAEVVRTMAQELLKATGVEG